MFDCPFRVAAPLSNSRSCPVALKSQLCECLATKKGATFLAFRSKTDPSNGLQWTRNESLVGYFYPPPLLSCSLFLLACIFSFRDCHIVEGVRSFRRRFSSVKPFKCRRILSREIHVWPVYRVGDTSANQTEGIKDRMCFMDHTYTDPVASRCATYKYEKRVSDYLFPVHTYLYKSTVNYF